jgi:hypothetical protein
MLVLQQDEVLPFFPGLQPEWPGAAGMAAEVFAIRLDGFMGTMEQYSMLSNPRIGLKGRDNRNLNVLSSRACESATARRIDAIVKDPGPAAGRTWIQQTVKAIDHIRGDKPPAPAARKAGSS